MIKKEISHIINISGGEDLKYLEYFKFIETAVKTALFAENINYGCEINVEITDNNGIQILNKEFRGKDVSTDVLSFPMGGDINPENGLAMLGDIVISAEKALEQSASLNQSFERELMFLAVHATLHLLGYDHEASEKDDLIMRKKQREIIEKIEKINNI